MSAWVAIEKVVKRDGKTSLCLSFIQKMKTKAVTKQVKTIDTISDNARKHDGNNTKQQ